MIGLTTLLLATMPALAGAQAGRYGAVADMPAARTGGGWTAQGWTGPEDGPDMTRLPPEERRVVTAPPPLTPPPVRVAAPVVRAVPPLHDASPAPVRPSMRAMAPAPAFLPYDGRYARPDRGGVLPRFFAAPAYQVRDFQARGLGVPGPGRHWVRYYDDAVLVGPGGRIEDVRYALDWERADGMTLARNDRRLPPPHRPLPARAYDDGYEDGYDDGHDDGVAWADDTAPPVGRYGQPDGHAPGTVVVTTTPGTITTTTTVTEDVVYTRVARPRLRAAAVRGKSRSAPARRWSK